MIFFCFYPIVFTFFLTINILYNIIESVYYYNSLKRVVLL